MFQTIYSFFESIFCVNVEDINGDFPFDDLILNVGVDTSMSLSRYLTLICSIIGMVVIIVLACLFIKKIYNMCAHIIA